MSGSSTCNQESDSKLKKRPPGLMNFPLMKKSNLLDRVGAFLPQIQAANQELLTANNDADDDDNDDAGIRVDLNLEQANDDDDDDDDKESEGDKSEAKEEEFLIREHQPGKSSKAIQKEETKPSIQLEFSIGQFDKNSPAMKLLGDNSDSSSEEREEEEEDEDEKRNLLQRLETSNTKRKAAAESTNTKATTSQKRPKGPLITELS